MMGWECPKCGRCYAPAISDCWSCNNQVAESTTNNLDICFHMFRVNDKCQLCDDDNSPVILKQESDQQII